MLAKLNNDKLFQAPKVITISNPKENLLIDYFGYKKYIEEDKPKYDKKTQELKPLYTETEEEIKCSWEIKNIEEVEEALD